MTDNEKQMKDAIALANWFVEKAKEDQTDITLLKLLKLVYIAHGYLLALLDKSFINPIFDKVEAWKFGPVIPSVYHTFKHNKDNPITEEEAICIVRDNNEEEMQFFTPKVCDEIVPVLVFVWNRYGSKRPSELVTILHRSGTPWEYHYKKGENKEIPDEDTKLYYKAIVRELIK